jgi:serine/threonine-protein kinase HipA
MMSSNLIDDKHFATLRFDRQHGIKQHVLTASGMTGWDFKSSENSSYENLFKLATFLKIPHSQIEELFKRMVFNIIFCNTDDHLKNHSFIYDNKNDSWNLSPAYDLTYSLNPLINFKRVSRALAINSKRVDISLNDMLKIADTYTIKNPKGIITEVQESIAFWQQKANELGIHAAIIQSVEKGFKVFVD